MSYEEISKVHEDFEVSYRKNNKQFRIKTKKVILATGFYENPNMLDINGEELEHVSHYYREPYDHYGQDVIVVGGKNSAVEAALDLHRNGARVTIVHRRQEIKESVKYWVLPDIQNRINEGSIKSYTNAYLKLIRPGFVEMCTKDGIKELPADAVYLLTGYHPDSSIFNVCNVEFDPQTLEPRVNSDSLESSQSGLYLAGSLIAGRNANKIFIENSREHGEIILSDIEIKL